MKLEPPLTGLIARCETMCVAECCGITAYDFSPIQIASYSTMYRDKPDLSELRVLRGQIESLSANYGTKGASGRGATFDDLNQIFTGEQVDAFAAELLANIEIALQLIEQSDRLRYENSDRLRH